MQVATALAAYLATLGLGGWEPAGTGGSLYVGWRPSSPDELVCLTELPGPVPPSREGIVDQATPGTEPITVQAITRGPRTTDVRPAWTQALRLAAALDRLDDVPLPGGVHLIACAAQQTRPAQLGPDDSGRHELSQNWTVIAAVPAPVTP